MKRIEKIGLLVGAAVGLTGASAWAAEPTSNDDQVRAVVSEMLNDAETRTSLLAGGDAGHDGRFFIAGDGFRLNIGGQLQFRHYINWRNDENTDDTQSDFVNARTRLMASGTINKDWDFRIWGDFDRGGSGSFNLEDAWIQYNFANGWKLKFGQFILPLIREWNVWDAKQLAVERSLTSDAFGQHWSQGIQASYSADSWRVFVAGSDGLNSANTDISTTGQTNVPPYETTSAFLISGSADYAVTGRAEFLFKGNFKQFDDFTSPRGSDYGCMAGVAAHWQQSPNTNASTDTDRGTLEYTGDIGFKGDGWNIYASGIGRYENFRAAGSNNEFNDFGVIVGGGLYISEHNELFVRYDGMYLDSDRFNTGDHNFSFITFGFNHYYAGHAAKLTVDAVWSLDSTTNLQSLNVLPDTMVGLIGESDRNEVTIRTQFQLLF